MFLVDFDERVLELGLRLLQSAGYRGFAQVEFAHDARDDTFRLLEVNTRLPMWAGVAMSRYFDLARIAYDDLCGGAARPSRGLPRRGRVDLLREGRVGVAADAAAAATSACASSSRPYLRRKKVRSVLAADDPLPALAAMNYLRSKLR